MIEEFKVDMLLFAIGGSVVGIGYVLNEDDPKVSKIVIGVGVALLLLGGIKGLVDMAKINRGNQAKEDAQKYREDISK